ncbi:MAG: YebC/PmpR family DNA-binding transcriptional regulator [Prolixibacteraceae bacterium]|nr:YebC/PmpR family DNA-binding transcriptional regulator [Prolixibacteraceae bacterium]MBN2650581.1 YebC/PmpR family DNA-binding transcriptional regulator [Prolixibacteraceae bacterium]
MGRAFEYRRAAKEKRWDKMSRIFPKLGKAITVAAKSGGEDPDLNPALRTAIQNAKAQNMPKANIDAAIKRASGKDAENYTEELYEGKGPFGTMFMVECMTDNHTRTVANMKWMFNKWGQGLVPSGSMEFMFSRKAVVEFQKPEMDIEELEMALIDAGLEELDENDGVMYAYADFTDFGSLTSAVEELGIEITKANLQRIPNDTIELTDEQMEEVEKLLDKIEEDDDVQQVFTNIA